MQDSTTDKPKLANDSQTPEFSDAASKPFVGRWHKLASETNWEKGRIILEWRNALIEAKAPSSQYSDEAWANRVGFVTCQHVGRLRRVFERFGETYGEYPKLYWSHFWAAIEWDDAELWLEGASNSRWSISQMCRMRTESMQLADGQTTESVMAIESERIQAESDDGFLDSTSSASGNSITTKDNNQQEDSQKQSDRSFESSPLAEGPDFGEHESDASGISASCQSHQTADDPTLLRNPFEGLGPLPLDVTEAVDPLKLCILRYRSSQWDGFSKSQMLNLIEALKGFCE
jgi:hypothetical protein